MEELRARFSETVERTSNVRSFRFLWPDRPVDFIPGQFLRVIFDEQDRKNKELNKYLSFSCDLGKPFFEVTKKLTGSDFSKRLGALRSEDQVLFQMPMGQCVLTPQMKQFLFLAGGIGITPVVSILEHIVNHQQDVDVKLIYSNWTEADIAFRSEIDQWARSGRSISVVHTLVNEEPKDSAIKHGIMDERFLSEYREDLMNRYVFIFGPPAMVKALAPVCLKLGCMPEKLKTESFMGYE